MQNQIQIHSFSISVWQSQLPNFYAVVNGSEIVTHYEFVTSRSVDMSIVHHFYVWVAF